MMMCVLATLPGKCERENSSLWRRILVCVVESVSPKNTQRKFTQCVGEEHTNIRAKQKK